MRAHLDEASLIKVARGRPAGGGAFDDHNPLDRRGLDGNEGEHVERVLKAGWRRQSASIRPWRVSRC
eukprot:2532820-Prymnesium_polylepis.2